MKAFIVVIALFILSASSSFTQTVPHKKAAVPGAAKRQTHMIYRCPMHPEVTSDKPGKCPKCKMDLVKIDNSTPAGTSPAAPAVEKKASVKPADIYVCPMHPEVTSDKPGRCPKCKMNLVRKTS